MHHLALALEQDVSSSSLGVHKKIFWLNNTQQKCVKLNAKVFLAEAKSSNLLSFNQIY
jgi:hypothetical protein